MQTIDLVMKEQFKRRSLKYRVFFIGLLLEKYIFKYDKLDKANERGTLLRNYYFLMRYLDDIIDGDITIKNYNLIEDRIKYLEEKLNNFLCGLKPQDDVDMMIQECHNLANEIGFSMENESKCIINSLIFDGKRFLQWQKNKELSIVSFETLNKHFYDLDIIGTISGCLKIYNEDERHIDSLHPLGTASRKYYDLRDFVEDVKRGLINISLEDMKKYNITENDIFSVMNMPDDYINLWKNKSFNTPEILDLLPQSILNFLIDGLRYCEDSLASYHDSIDSSSVPNLRASTKLTLKYGYENPIKKFINISK